MRNIVEDAAYIQKIENALDPYHRHLEYDWDRNILKILGKHWIELHKNSSGWQSASNRYKRVSKQYPMPVTNLVSDKLYTIKSNIVRNFPLPYAANKVSNHKAKRAASYINALMKYYSDSIKLNYKKIVSDEVDWALATGGCIVVPYANFDSGKYITEYAQEERTEMIPQQVKICSICGYDGNTEQDMNCQNCGSSELMPASVPKPVTNVVDVMNKDGTPRVKKTIPVFEPGVEVTPYYEWLIDPLVSDFYDARWLIRRRVKDVDWIEQTYNKKIEPNPDNVMNRWYKARLNSWSGGNYGDVTAEYAGFRDFMENSVVIREYYRRPYGIKDNGKYIVVVGDDIIVDEGFPWDDNKWHYSHIPYNKVVGRNYGQSLASNIIPINDMINRIDQAIIWSRYTTVNPITVNPVGSGIDNQELQGGFGTKIVRPVDPLLVPSYISPSPLPAHVFEERAKRLEDIERMAVSDPMGGKLPGSRTPASVINMSIEQSSAKFSQFINNLIDGNVRMWWEIIRLCQKNMPDDRKYAIMGDDEQNYETLEFSGMELVGDTEYDDGGVLLSINLDDAEPKSRAAEKQQLMEAVQAGLLNPQEPFTRQRAMEVWGLDKKLNDSMSLDQKAAERELVEMESGIDVTQQYMQMYGSPIKPGENVNIHSEIHRRYMQKEQFQQLDPNVQGIFIRHFQETEKIKMQQQQQQMMMQAQMAMVQKGAPSPNKMGG